MNSFNIKSLLEIILKVTNKNAYILAHSYLMKDVSIISKWKNNKILPKSDDISRIVDFVLCESTVTQRNIIRDRIEELINSSPIKSDLRDIILQSEDFGEFLKEALNVSVSSSFDPSEIQSLESPKALNDNIITGIIQNNNGRFTGTLEFDLAVEKNAAGQPDNSIKFISKANIVSKSTLEKAGKYFKRSSAFGFVIIWIAVGAFVAFSDDTTSPAVTQPDIKKVYSSKVSEKSAEETSNKGQNTIQSTSTPAPVNTAVITTAPIPSSQPEKVAAVKPSTSKQNVKENNQPPRSSKQTINNNTTINNTTTNININGDDAFFVQGKDIAIDFGSN